MIIAGPMLRFTVSHKPNASLPERTWDPFGKFNLVFSALLSPTETSDGRVPLLGAAGEQQLQHLPLQEVPQHVCGTEADWPVQVWEQNWTRSEGHPVSPHVRQVLSAVPSARRGKTKMWRQWRPSGSQIVAPLKITVMLLRLIHPNVLFRYHLVQLLHPPAAPCLQYELGAWLYTTPMLS